MSAQPQPPNRDDLAAAIATRRELGPDYDAAIADLLLARMAAQIDARVDQRMAAGGRPQFVQRPPRGERPSVALGVLSLPFVIGAPSATSNFGDVGSLIASILIWTAIIAINAIYALSRRPR